MAYKIVKALQPLDFAKKHVKKGDQIELDAAEADDLIKRGLAEEGSMESPASEAHPDVVGTDLNRPTDSARPLTTGSLLAQPENKMSPDASPK